MSRMLTIEIAPDWEAGLRTNAERAFAGEVVGEVLSFRSPELFFGKLSPNRWKLVRELQSGGPAGAQEIARRSGCDVRRVNEDLRILLELGLLEKTESGQICCPYDDIHVDMHLRAA